MKLSSFLLLFGFSICILLAGCGMETQEVFTINPDLSGKCAITVKMTLDTSSLDAKLAAKDSMYGIIPPFINFHKNRFSRKDAMKLALKMIKSRGIEVWNNINFGLSKKKDQIYFGGTAYFRDISKVHFSMLDSTLQVAHEIGSKTVFTINPEPTPSSSKAIPDDTIEQRVARLRKNAFYIRPILAELMKYTETTIVYNLPGKIISSSIFDQQGDNVVTLELTGNEIMKYADSLAQNQDLAVKEYKATSGTCQNVLEPLFNRIAYSTGVPISVEFNKGSKPLFDYFGEVQSSMIYYDNYMEQSKLEQYDSTSSIKEERVESRRPEEYGKLIVNKMDSIAKKPYFNDMIAVQSHDTITVSGEISEDIKADESKIHILRLIAGEDQDITDSIVAKNKIPLKLLTAQGKEDAKAPKRKVSFMFIVHFPPGCKEVAIQGRLSTTVSGKPGVQASFKIKQIAVSAKAK